LDGPLIIVRAVHFAATAQTAGALAFLMLVAAPAARAAMLPVPPLALHLRIAWLSLAVALLSGLAWAVLEVAAMSGLPLHEAVTEGMVPVVLTQTNFGIVSCVRCGLAVLVAIALAFARAEAARWTALACATALLGSLAWTGHAVGTVGAMALPHLVGDALHCLAAGAWVGGLLPLALLLASARRHDDPQWDKFAYVATRRFSTLGIASVATLVVTGLLNAWILVGSLSALTATDHGRLLQVKLALFALMLGLAGVNRLHWTPHLAQASGPLRSQALRQLTRYSTVEAGLALALFIIVGALGTVHPAIHLVTR
jgi:putative copper resistance protein D